MSNKTSENVKYNKVRGGKQRDGIGRVKVRLRVRISCHVLLSSLSQLTYLAIYLSCYCLATPLILLSAPTLSHYIVLASTAPPCLPPITKTIQDQIGNTTQHNNTTKHRQHKITQDTTKEARQTTSPQGWVAKMKKGY